MKAAEQARVAAEKKKQVEDEKLAAAERAKAAAQAKAAETERLAAEKARLVAEKKQQAEDAKLALAEKERAAAQAKKLEETRIASVEQAAGDERPSGEKPADQATAALAPAGAAKSDSPPTQDIPRLLQSELRRVGCKTGETDSEWNASARRALSSFNDNAKTKFDVKFASLDALDAVRAKEGRVCPIEKRPERAPKVAQQRERKPAAARRGGKCFVYNGASFCE
jgi:hypothetical protein